MADIDLETAKFIQLALSCRALWTNHHVRADGAMSVAQRRIDRFREAVKANDPDAIGGLDAAVLGSAHKTIPWTWMISHERDTTQLEWVRRDVPLLEQSDHALVEYVIQHLSKGHPAIDALRQASLNQRDPDAVRRTLSYMRAVLHANAQFWLRERGIKLSLNDDAENPAASQRIETNQGTPGRWPRSNWAWAHSIADLSRHRL